MGGTLPRAVRGAASLRVLVLVAVSAAGLALFAWQTDLGAMWSTLRGADPWLVTAALLLFLAHHAVRAVRWRLLLVHLHDCGRWLPMWAITIGVSLNNTLPAKAGLVARAHLVSVRSPISRAAVGSSLVVEGLFDGLLVLACVGVGLAFVPLGDEIRSSALAFTGLMALLALAALLVATNRMPARPLLALTRRCPPRIDAVLCDVGRHIGEGMQALRSARHAGQVLVATTALYVLWIASFLLLGASMDLGISVPEAIAVVAVTNVAVALPGAGGGVGTFEVVMAHAVAAMGVADAGAAAYAVAIHALMLVPLTLLGFVFLGLGWRIAPAAWQRAPLEVVPAEPEDAAGPAGEGGAIVAFPAPAPEAVPALSERAA